jgi:hypothetical protein
MGGSDQNQGADCGHREKSQSASRRNSELQKNPSAEHSANQAKHDIGDDPVTSATHQLAGDPSRDKSNENRSK